MVFTLETFAADTFAVRVKELFKGFTSAETTYDASVAVYDLALQAQALGDLELARKLHQLSEACHNQRYVITFRDQISKMTPSEWKERRAALKDKKYHTLRAAASLLRIGCVASDSC